MHSLDYGSRYILRLHENRISHSTKTAAPRNSSSVSPLHKVALRRGYFILKLATSSIHPSVYLLPRLFHETLDRVDDQLEKLNYFLK